MNGERVFIALLTVTNEYGEIRICNLVATKSHSQFVLSLEKLADSLALYGHAQPAIFYTDNMADKSFLEAAFPSLRENIKPVEKYGHLTPFVLPSNIDIITRSDEGSINGILSEIIQAVPEDASEPDIVVGFDCEWNFMLGDHGRLESRGKVALVQLAFKTKVFILQVSHT